MSGLRNRLQHQPWGWQLLEAAERLGVTLSLPPAPPVMRAARLPPVVLNPAVPHVVVNRGALQQRAAAGPVAAAPPPAEAPLPRGLSARGVVLLQADILRPDIHRCAVRRCGPGECDTALGVAGCGATGAIRGERDVLATTGGSQGG